MAYIRSIVPTVPFASLLPTITPVFGTVAGQTSGTSGVAFPYHAYLERICNSLENLSESTYILAGIFTTVQAGPLLSVTGTISGSVVSGIPSAAIALMAPGMILTPTAYKPAVGAGWFGGLTKIATINNDGSSITISSQFPNLDGPLTFTAGGHGIFACTPTVTSIQADPRPGMLLTGENILPGTVILDYVVPGVPDAFYVNIPQRTDPTNPLTLVGAIGPLAALGQSITNIDANLSALVNMGNNQGFHAVDPYSMVQKATEYAYYAQNPGQLDALISELANLPAEFATIKNILKGVTKLP
jgi:hypothetical protein